MKPTHVERQKNNEERERELSSCVCCIGKPKMLLLKSSNFFTMVIYFLICIPLSLSLSNCEQTNNKQGDQKSFSYKKEPTEKSTGHTTKKALKIKMKARVSKLLLLHFIICWLKL